MVQDFTLPRGRGVKLENFPLSLSAAKRKAISKAVMFDFSQSLVLFPNDGLSTFSISRVV